MPDISMCNGDNCPSKDKCYRHMAIPDQYQGYFAAPPIKDGKCYYFSAIDDSLKLRKKP